VSNLRRASQGDRAEKLAADKFVEEKRHNKATEGQARESSSNTRGQIVQTDSGPVLVDPRTGTGRAVTGPDGSQLPGQTKPLTDSQSKALLFGTRMQEADKILQKLESEGTSASVPGARYGAVSPFLSDNQQMLNQAKQDFMTAVLRRESGAAISSGEFATAEKQYFPQIGDSDAVKAQKARNRQLALKGVLVEVPEKQRGSITPAAPTSGTPAIPSGWSVQEH
jgi:hypothetical protein